MEINDYILKIKELGACEEAVLAAHSYKTSQELWDDCQRGDWMLWLIGKFSGEPGCDKRKKLVLSACKCARLALPYIEKDELWPLKAIETAEQWARGENNVTIDDVESAANATYAYAYAANAAYYAAYATAYAAYAAYAATYAANAAYATAKQETLKQCAEIVRLDYPAVDDLFETAFKKDGEECVK